MLEPAGQDTPPTMREVLGDRRKAGKIINMLVTDRAWVQRDVDKYVSSQTGELNDAGKGKQKGLVASEVKPTDTVDDAIAAVIESPTLAGQQPTRRFAEKAAAARAKADAVASEIKQAVKDLGKLIAGSTPVP